MKFLSLGQDLLKISSKMFFFYCIISFLHYLKYKTCILFIFIFRIAYIAKNLGFFSILKIGGWGYSMPSNLSVTL